MKEDTEEKGGERWIESGNKEKNSEKKKTKRTKYLEENKMKNRMNEKKESELWVE